MLQQLKKLREGRGLSVERLGDSPAVLSALGSTDPTEAMDTLLGALAQLGDGERIRALKVDLGLDLDEPLGRSPTGRECDWLGDRRQAYALQVGRDVKTVRRWSDDSLGELRGLLLTDRFDGHLLVAAGVKNRRLTGIEVMRYEREDETFSHGRDLGYSKPEPGTSLPLVLFGFPADWQPLSLGFVVAFIEETPERVWSLAADNIIDIGFGHQRTELKVVDGMARCKFEEPTWERLYGVWWA